MSLATRRALGFLILFLAMDVTRASAQMCAGRPEFSQYKWQTSLGLPFNKQVLLNGLSASLGAGRDSLFAVATGKIVQSSGGSGAKSLGVNTGVNLTISREHHIYACPVVSAIQTWGPDQTRFLADGRRETLVNTSTGALTAGGRFSVLLTESTSRQIGPILGVHFVREQTTRTPVATGLDTVNSDSYGVAEAGLTLVLREQISFSPIMSVPFKSDTAELELLFLITVGFGLR